IVYALARICLLFIYGDLLGWVAYLKRSGQSAAQVSSLSAARAHQLVEATYQRKWLLGIQRLDARAFPLRGFEKAGETGEDPWRRAYEEWSLNSERFTDKAWVQDAWTVIVEENIQEDITEGLGMILLGTESSKARLDPRTDMFLSKVRSVTGRRMR